MESVLNRHISYYPNRFAIDKGVPVNLILLLHSQQHKQTILNLRNEPDPNKQQLIKEQLPCFTVAGIFSTRNNTGLKHPSGLACVDLDAAEDYNTTSLLQQLKQIPYIAYAGLSCRGKRLYLIVPFATNQYERHYERLIESFTAMQLPMGDCCHKSISQPRNVSYNDDTTHWFNHFALPFSKLPKPRTVYLPTKPHLLHTHSTVNFNQCVEHINKTHQFKPGQRHAYLVALAGYCKWKQLSKQDALTGCLEFAENGFTVKEIRGILDYFYKG